MYKLWGGFVFFFNKRPNIFLSGKTNSGETHFKSCDISKHSIWPSVNFDIPQCFSWQSPSVYSCLWNLQSGCFQIGRPWCLHNLLQMIWSSCLASFYLSRKVCNVFLRINIEIVSQDTNNQLNLIMLFYKCGSVILLTWWVCSCSNQSDQSKIYKYK